MHLNSVKWARKVHKWLMTLIGLQFLIWSITGLYMVVMDIHFIHGESLVNSNKVQKRIKLNDVNFGVSDVLERFPKATSISLTSLLNKPVYKLKLSDKDTYYSLLDANSGDKLPTITQDLALEIAQQKLAFLYPVREIERLTDIAPSELSSRYLPVWKVEFEHFSSPTFYISEHSGELVTKRHDYWRIFDWMWRFHITDYDDGENITNGFLFLLAILGLLSTIMGIVLLYATVIKANREKAESV